MFHYEVEVGFDDAVASVPDNRAYFSFLETHAATGIGHDKAGTSTAFFFSDERLDREDLQRELGDLEILTFEETEKAA